MGEQKSAQQRKEVEKFKETPMTFEVPCFVRPTRILPGTRIVVIIDWVLAELHEVEEKLQQRFPKKGRGVRPSQLLS